MSDKTNSDVSPTGRTRVFSRPFRDVLSNVPREGLAPGELAMAREFAVGVDPATRGAAAVLRTGGRIMYYSREVNCAELEQRVAALAPPKPLPDLLRGRSTGKTEAPETYTCAHTPCSGYACPLCGLIGRRLCPADPARPLYLGGYTGAFGQLHYTARLFGVRSSSPG